LAATKDVDCFEKHHRSGSRGGDQSGSRCRLRRGELCAEGKHSIPPANAPSVITVGGYDDKNDLDPTTIDLYHSNFGPTADGTVKPEIIAPAMWVAAPICSRH